MKIELLYFDSCHMYRETKKILEEILREKNMEQKIEMIRVNSDEEAKLLKFLGSPTVRINGKDIDPMAEGMKDFGMKCRIYMINGKIYEGPTKELIMKAMEEVAK